MDLDFDKYCLVDGSPTTVLPAPRHRSSVANRKSSGKSKHRNGTPSLTEQLEIDIGDYYSGACRDARSQRVSREGKMLERESVYQSSQEVKLIHSTDACVNGREKIELSAGAASLFSLGIIDSLCSLEEESLQLKHTRDSVMSLSEQSMTSANEDGAEFCYDYSAPAIIEEKNAAFSLHRSLSAIFSLPRSPAKSECDSSRASSPKARFSPVKKMLRPFVKSKFGRSPLSNLCETHSESGLGGSNRNRLDCRPLMGDILDNPDHEESNHQNEEKEIHNSVPQCSPAHLHGLLRMGNKHGAPYFQFSVKSPEDVYVAKTWKVENASTYVYTFHLVPRRRKRSSREWGFKEWNRESCIVGRMQVSCQQYTEFKGSGQLNEFVVTEFVLQDILNSGRSTASQDDTSCNNDTDPFGSSAAANLRPELEMAAIVMQVPLEKRESLKFKSGDKKTDETLTKLLDICQLGKSEGTSCTSSPGTMHVVIPAGSHSFPISGSCGPSPLLDRWRMGGGCDCGGWDMACPLNIFTNKIAEGQPPVHNHSQADIFVQGRKDDVPAFSMRVMEDGKYAVDFHAQLSSLQAFAIGVAILHAGDAADASIINQARSKSKPVVQSDSFIKTMQDTRVAEEETSKAKEMEELIKPSFILNPPFSPIARV